MKKIEGRSNYFAGYMDDDGSILVRTSASHGERMQDFLRPDPRRCLVVNRKYQTEGVGKLSDDEKAVIKGLCEKYPDRLSLSDYL